MPHQHTSKRFDAEMEAVRNLILKMGGLVETQLNRADAILRSSESGSVEAIWAVEQQINELQMQIDQSCSQIITRRQPTAIDLRMVLTFEKTANELERVGDEAKKVAAKAAAIDGAISLNKVRIHDVSRMCEDARQLLQGALDALVRLDVQAAADVIARDDAIDAQFLAIMRQLISYMMEDPRTISAALEIVFIAKSLERVGDHAKNIAEYVVHVVKGKDMRHASVAAIRQEIGE
ncbi:MAG: phosphate signaling complex protein PhoU [Burkholderiales bacterium]|nr:phosphate signaling complex protein PhoU [Burkholderiales bacterium]